MNFIYRVTNYIEVQINEVIRALHLLQLCPETSSFSVTTVLPKINEDYEEIRDSTVKKIKLS